MKTAPPLERLQSASWSARSAPSTSVVIATHDRAGFLPALFAALEGLHPPTGGLEVVIADDGSRDGTWGELQGLVRTTPVPVLALRLAACGGPSVPRNSAVEHSRGALLLLTDDDCLPEPGWAVALVAASTDAVGVVQGRTLPAEEGPSGVWDRTITVQTASGLFETCNLAIRREAFVQAGGFPLIEALGTAPRGFGEDVLLGLAVERGYGSGWAPDAVVRHRWLPGSFRQHLAGKRRLSGFPLLVREAPELRAILWRRFFLTPRTASLDAAVLGIALCVASRRPAPLLAALPWLRFVLREARRRPGRPFAWRLAQVALADGTASAGLVAGSIRHRRAVL